MPIRYEKRCAVCRLAKHDRALAKRILNSTKFSEWGTESLQLIQRDYAAAFSYVSILNHSNRHIKLTEAEQLAITAKLAPPMEKSAEEPPSPPQPAQLQLTPVEDTVFDNVIQQGLEKLKNGEMEITANHLLKAADSKANLNLKRKDQQLKLQEMIWHFASGQAEGSAAYDTRLIEGEAATAYDAAAITTGNVDAGEARPSTVHQPVTWDAVASGSGEVLAPYTDGADEAA